jgi:hypothetical protein
MFHSSNPFFKNLDLNQGFGILHNTTTSGSLVALRLPPARIAAIRPLQAFT